jgi:hypothetical protein
MLSSDTGSEKKKEGNHDNHSSHFVASVARKARSLRQFCQILQGSRRCEYEAWREQMGITQEEAWLSETSQGDLVRIHLQVEHPEQVLADLARSPRPFDRWLRQHLLELHGLDLAQLVPASAHELIFAWQPEHEPRAWLDGRRDPSRSLH